MTWKPNVRPGVLPEGYTPTRSRRTESWWRVIPRHWYKYGWRVEVRDGGEFPIGYGLAFTEFNTLTHVFYPIPFNLIVRGFRDLFHWVSRGGWWGPYEGEDKVQHEMAKRLQLEKVRIPPQMTLFPANTTMFEPDGIHQVTLQFPDADSAVVFYEWCKQIVINSERHARHARHDRYMQNDIADTEQEG